MSSSSSAATQITLRELTGSSFVIQKYPPAATVSLWPLLLPLTEPKAPPSSHFLSISITATELSIVTTAETQLPKVEGFSMKVESGYSAFVVDGKLDFALVGILSALTGALAAHGVSVFAVSTYDTDYLLVKTDKKEEAIKAWASAGCSFM
ncbi:hypothetical protein HDU76_004562 [Blyttiomyces sp. JEL0837]|nr:hypothetical protein HDU76_004562 [Blyttiomyces sp. JEL0837]